MNNYDRLLNNSDYNLMKESVRDILKEEIKTEIIRRYPYGSITD